MKSWFVSGTVAGLLAVLVSGCGTIGGHGSGTTFGSDVAFLQKYTDVLVLKDPASRACVAVAQEMQGRVLTSSADGNSGASHGWINRELIAAKTRQPHMNAFGGEDRIWLGPEGGQFSIFFNAGDPFDLEHWQTPEAIDWGPWELARKDVNQACYSKKLSLTNYSGTIFNVAADRIIRVYSRSEIEKFLAISIGETSVVGYETANRVRNLGPLPWDKSTGLLSIWILGMFNPAPSTVIVIPFKTGGTNTLGPVINDAYFGKVPADRLKTDTKRGLVFFKGDGKYRSKIGVSPARARDVMGSYDPDQGLLTIVKYSLPGTTTDYVNSMWELQTEPFKGDAANSYNDGPPEPGKKPLGPFYELESSSPALALKPGEKAQHIHRTFHFVGPKESLDAIALKTLGVKLNDITAAFATAAEAVPDKPAPAMNVKPNDKTK